MRKSLITFSLAAVAALAIAGPADARGGIPSGYYQCYQTTSSVWAPTGARTYATSFARSFTLRRNGTYTVQLQAVYGRSRWTFAKRTLKFRSGEFWGGFRHAVGTYRRAGKLMPHSTMNPTQRYPLVLRDVRANDSDALPQRETADASFWYCKIRSGSAPAASNPPVPKPVAPTPTPQPVAPTPAPAPAPGGIPPVGTYICNDKSGYFLAQFDLLANFQYQARNSTVGSYSADQASGRVDFQGGFYDDSAVGRHYFGTYTAPGSIVVQPVGQATYGGPDADEIGTHSFWHCHLS